MDWIETPESSNISRFAYDATTSVLSIEFKKGGLYQYFDVPVHIFESLKASESKGQFFAQQIKGVFRFARA